MRSYNLLLLLCIHVQFIFSQPKNDNDKFPVKNVLAAGGFHSLFIRNGTINAAGQNVYGQLGVANKADAAVPVPIKLATNFVKISTCRYNNLALRADQTIWAWGFNNYGEAGNGTKTHQFIPSMVGKDTTWLEIAAGESFCLAIKENGTLWGWGLNSNGELGTGGTPYNSLIPIQIGKDK
ncbi:MAG: RCC1 domain-containing protein, partial [Flavitalea sp.]